MHRLLPVTLALAGLGLVAASGVRAEAILPGDIRLYHELTTSKSTRGPGRAVREILDERREVEVTRSNSNSAYVAPVVNPFSWNRSEIDLARRKQTARAIRGDFAPR